MFGSVRDDVVMGIGHRVFHSQGIEDISLHVWQELLAGDSLYDGAYYST